MGGASISAVRKQIEVLQPRWVIPFASFIWFCHEENCFMNNEVNHIGDVARGLGDGSSAVPVVMYPGDSWKVGDPFGSAPALARYGEDLSSIRINYRHRVLKSRSVAASSLFELAALPRKQLRMMHRRLVEAYVTAWNLRRSFSQSRPLGLRRTPLAVTRMILGRMEPTYIFVSDHDQSYSYSLQHGLRRVERAREACDVALASDSLALCFRLPWGAETLRINGRFEALPNGQYHRFFILFMVLRSSNLGAPLTWNRLLPPRFRRRWLRGS
jgi:hypothetical protein